MKRLMTIFAALLFCAISYAQEQPPRVAATTETAMQFSRIGHSPVIEAMGGAGLTSTSDVAWASYYNPAVVPFAAKKNNFAVSYNTWRPSSTYLNIAGSFNINDQVGVTGGATLGMGKTMQITDEFGTDTGIFRPMDYQANVGVAYRFVDWMSIGVNARFLGQTLYKGIRQFAFGTDVYVMGSWKGIKGTVGFDNLGTRVKDLSGRQWNIPSSVTFAAGYENVFWNAHGFEAEIRGDYYFIEDRAVVTNPFCLSIGAGYSYKFVSARFGFHYGADSAVIPTFGSAGITLRLANIHMDAMYYIAKEGCPLKNNLSFGLGYGF